MKLSHAHYMTEHLLLSFPPHPQPLLSPSFSQMASEEINTLSQCTPSCFSLVLTLQPYGLAACQVPLYMGFSRQEY